jgi:HAD superfamily hydrolase (TIGR01549 family)
MLEAVIFDIDGTIVDSVDFHANAWKAAFKKFGKDIPFKAIRSQIGKGADQLLPIFFSRDALKDFGEEMEKYRSDLYKKRYLPRVKAFPQVRELFERIKNDRILISLASSAKEDELKRYKKIAQVEDLIDTEVSSDNANKSKPFPDIFQVALEKLNKIDPATVIVIGDTRYDAEAASKAKVRAIGFLSGGSSEEELREAGCIAIYRHPVDLLAQYEKSPFSKTWRCNPTKA